MSAAWPVIARKACIYGPKQGISVLYIVNLPDFLTVWTERGPKLVSYGKIWKFFRDFVTRIEHDGPRTAISPASEREAKFECAPNVPQTCPRRTLSAPTDEPRASCGLPTQSRPIRRSSDEARSARRGKARAAPGKVRRGLAQSRSRDRPRSHGRWRRGEAEPGRREWDPVEARQSARRKAGSGRSSTTSASLKRSKPSKVPQARKSRKPATPQALKPQVPQSRKSRNPSQVPQDQQSRKPPQSRNPLNPRSSRKPCKPLAKSFCAF